MGVLDAALRAKEIGRQSNSGLVDSLLGAMGTARGVMENNYQVDKANNFKKAGQELAALGGLSPENIKIVVEKYDLDPEQTKELVTTWGSFHETMNKLKEKPIAEYDIGYKDGRAVKVPKGEQWPEGVLTQKQLELESKKPTTGQTEYKFQKFDNDWYVTTKGSKVPEKVKEGSIEGKALSYAQRSDAWKWAEMSGDEAEMSRLLNLYVNILKKGELGAGTPQPHPSDLDAEVAAELEAQAKQRPTLRDADNAKLTTRGQGIPPDAKAVKNAKTGEKAWAWKDSEGKWHTEKR